MGAKRGGGLRRGRENACSRTHTLRYNSGRGGNVRPGGRPLGPPVMCIRVCVSPRARSRAKLVLPLGDPINWCPDVEIPKTNMMEVKNSTGTRKTDRGCECENVCFSEQEGVHVVSRIFAGFRLRSSREDPGSCVLAAMWLVRIRWLTKSVL